MARFTRLTLNPLIGPKIDRVNVIYNPPVAAYDMPHECANVTLYYGMRLQNVKGIMTEYNEKYTDSRPADDSSKSRTVVDSGECERVLGEGLRRLPELSNVFVRVF